MNEQTDGAGATELLNEAEEGNTNTSSAAAQLSPNSVAGQRHVSPPGRHSQQARERAIARAQALGLTTERELYDHDRAEALAKLKRGTDGVLAQQRNEQARRSGTGTDKA